jgi:hypothetical protein
MWNFEGSYQTEVERRAALRAELDTEAELRRAACGDQAEERLVARLGRPLGMIGAQLKGEGEAPGRAPEGR